MIVLDTNVCVGILQSDPKVASHLAESNDLIAIPGMVAGGEASPPLLIEQSLQ